MTEFKTMVQALHEADIEVILDVVYNHTAEGNELGPTLSFKGIDNAAYYRLVDSDKSHYYDTTGTGNSLLMRHPHVLQLIMDSLRYWVTEMHVDGFRFDLASTLARQFHEVDRLSAFFDLVQQDPVVSQVKLIAEPWDVGDGGYQVGNFPPLWTEWNGKYPRHRARLLARREVHAGRVRLAADRLVATCTSDDSRRPLASINFVTAHDGFTLRDLVSYNDKHNEANGEGGNDGESHNRSWNCGVEGETDDPEVLRAAGQAAAQLPRHAADLAGRADARPRRRARPDPERQQQRLLPGQRARLGGLGSDRGAAGPAGVHPASWSGCATSTRCSGAAGSSTATPASTGSATWSGSRPTGSEMQNGDWSRDDARAVAVFLNGDAISEPDPRGEPVVDDSFLVLLNSNYEPRTSCCPPKEYGEAGPWWWTPIEADRSCRGATSRMPRAAPVRLEAHGTLVLTRPRQAAG